MEEKKLGRPSKYKPEYDAMLIEHMASGLSYECFGAVIDVCIDTLYEWEKHHASFSEAKKKAFLQNRLFWEKLGIQNIIDKSDSESTAGVGGSSKTRKLNSTVYIFNMKNRFPKEWRDRVELAGDKDAPLNLTLNYERKKKPSKE